MNKSVREEHPRGSVREMLAISLPMVVSLSCDTLMIFTDRLFLSKLSPELMNAAMGGGLTSFMMMSFFLGLTGYTTALAAQYLGAGKKDRPGLVLTQSLIFAFAAYPLILLCRPFGHMLFKSMGITGSQIVPQSQYFDILLYAVIISLLRNCFSSFFSGVGRTGVVMLASVVSLLVNASLNYVLIFGKCGFPVLGIQGAAYGTIIGGLSSLAVMAAKYFSRRNRDEFNIKGSLRFDRRIAGELLRFGYPCGLEMFLNIMAFNALVMAFHSSGTAAATAATIMFNWDMVSFLPLIGIEIGVTSLVGRCMGANDPDTAHRSAMSGLKLGLGYSFIILVLFVGFPGDLARLFKPAHESVIYDSALPIAEFMIRFASLYVLVDAMIVTFIGALRGAGDTFWAMCATVCAHWMVAGAAFFSMRFLGVSARAGWVIVVTVFIFFSFIIYRRYHGGKWMSIRILRNEPPMVGSEIFHEPVDL